VASLRQNQADRSPPVTQRGGPERIVQLPSKDTPVFTSFHFETEQYVDGTCFRILLANLPFEVFRVKGLVRFTDRVVFLNFVGGKGEWSECSDTGAHSCTTLVFVGWNNPNKDEFLERLHHCVKSI